LFAGGDHCTDSKGVGHPSEEIDMIRFGKTSLVVAIAAAACAGSIVAACVGDEAVPTTDASTPTPVVDAAIPVDSSTTPDASADTSKPVVDSATDAADAAKTFCDGQIAPVGFADFFCADFDGPGPFDQGFTSKNQSDGGTLARTTTVAFSDPASLLTSGGGMNRVGSLSWRKTGPTAFTQAVLTVRVNPDILAGVVAPNTGSVKMLEIITSNALVSLRYTAGGTVDGQANYTGYFFRAAAFGGAAALTEMRIATGLAANSWTNVKLSWAADGTASVSYNEVAVFNTSTFGSVDTALTFTVGSEGSGTTGGVPPYRYDNAMFAIRR
jgi:hypothetical protein